MKTFINIRLFIYIAIGSSLLSCRTEQVITGPIKYELLSVDSRWDTRQDTALVRALAPYKQALDSTMNIVIGQSAQNMPVDKPESLMTNWTADMVKEVVEKISGQKCDFSIMNTGGISTYLRKGDVTIGDIFSIFPFENTLSLVKMKGSDVRDLFEIISRRGGEGVSHEIRLVIKGNSTQSVSIAGKPIDDNKIYTIATIDYVADGNDDMVSFRKATERKDFPGTMRDITIEYIKKLTANKKPIKSSLEERITVDK